MMALTTQSQAYALPVADRAKGCTKGLRAALAKGRENALSRHLCSPAGAAMFKARKSYEVTVMLAEKDGQQVAHSTGGL